MLSLDEATRNVRHARGFDGLEMARRVARVAIDLDHVCIQMVANRSFRHRNARPEHPPEPFEDRIPARRFIDHPLAAGNGANMPHRKRSCQNTPYRRC